MFVQVRNLYKKFKSGNSTVNAVDDVSFTVDQGEILGIVGESGCGKTTLGKCIVGLIRPDDGEIIYDDSLKKCKRGKNGFDGKLQMVFQNPYNSLNPSKTIGENIGDNLVSGGLTDKEERIERLLGEVGIGKELIDRYPYELSGGQCQRIGIARALATDPGLMVCDEPLSALDVSVQAYIVNILKKIRKERNMTYLFISHDLNLVRYVADRILVMYQGKIVEEGRAEELFKNPQHPYTRKLIDSVYPVEPDAAKNRMYERYLRTGV